MVKTRVIAGFLAAAALTLAGCSSHPAKPTAAAKARQAAKTDLARSGGAVQNLQTGQVLRLGYTDDYASAPALAGLGLGLYREDLKTVTLQPAGYLSDLDEILALEHGQLDAAYLDPVAAITAWQATAPGTLKIIAGATASSSELIARPGISSPSQLRGKRVEAPADSTQAASLAQWLKNNNLTRHVRLDGSPVTTIGILNQFTKGTVSAAWEPAPLDQELTAAGGHILASTPAATITGVLVVTQRYLTANPAAVRSLLQAQGQACAKISAASHTTLMAVAMIIGQTAPGERNVPVSALNSITCASKTNRAAITAQAQAAAQAGVIRPTTSLGTFFAGLSSSRS